MAGFKTHVSVGIFTGFLLMIGAYMLAWVTSLTVAVLIFMNTTIGSFLPDIDSDSGYPVRILFGIYALVIAGIAFFISFHATNENIVLSLIAPAIAFLVVNFVFPPLFKKYSKHRGMFHSVPAIFISFLVTFLFLNLFNIPLIDRFLMAAAIGIGYFSHLLLDEVYSTNILSGKFKPKKSLGTALKFLSKSRTKAKTLNTIVYSILLVLTVLSFPMLIKVIKILIAA